MNKWRLLGILLCSLLQGLFIMPLEVRALDSWEKDVFTYKPLEEKMEEEGDGVGSMKLLGDGTCNTEIDYVDSKYYNFNSSAGSTSFDVGSDSNRTLFVVTTDNAGSDQVTSVTYNGVSLTNFKTNQMTYGYTKAWYLINPSSGSNTLAINRSSSGDTWVIMASYCGTNQDIQGDNIEYADINSTLISNSIDISRDNSWSMLFVEGSRALNVGYNTTFRVDNTAPFAFYDSNGVATSTIFQSVTQSDNTNSDIFQFEINGIDEEVSVGSDFLLYGNQIYATSTCTNISASTTNCVYNVSSIVGNITFGLAIIITLMSVMFMAWLFNSLTNSKRKLL